MRRRVLLVVGLTFLAMLAAMVGTSRWVIGGSFHDLERRAASDDMRRVRGAIDGRLRSLDRTAADWSAWDETYAFAGGGNRSYVEDNLADEMVSRIDLGAILLVDNDGHPVFGKAVDPATGASLGFPRTLAEFVASHPVYFRHAGRDSAASGIELLPEGPTLVVSRPVLDNRRERPIRGALVMARPVDAVLVRELARQTSLSFALLALSDPSIPPDLGAEDPVITQPAPDRISIFAALADPVGPPVAAIRIDEPAEIRARARVVLITTGAWMALAWLCFLAVTLWLLERMVLARLHRLSASVLTIGTSNDPSRRVEAHGRDEVGYLGAAINGMLESIERSTAELLVAEARGEAFLDAVPDLFFRVSRDGTIVDARLPVGLSFLPMGNELVGARLADLPGRFSMVQPAFVDKARAAIEQAITTGVPQTLMFTTGREGSGRAYECRIAAAGTVEVIALVRDITERELAEEARRKEILLREIHHRVKNNLQVITSLLALQARSTADERARAMLTESRDRVRSIAVIHEKLYEAGSGRVDFANYVRDLVAHVRTSWTGGSEEVGIDVEVENVALDLDVAVPCGLVINELLTNALKHAFPAGRRGTVRVSMGRRDGGHLLLQVADDGVGVPEGLEITTASSLGMRIVVILAQQLKGTLRLERPAEGGSSFLLEFAG
jgi:two-component sensor histidine kinase/sensor domain CHASE-containing protein